MADIASRKPGAKVQVGFVRNGKLQETTVTIADRAKLFAARLNEDDNGNDESTPKQSKFGVTVRKLTPEMAERLDMPAGKGRDRAGREAGFVCRGREPQPWGHNPRNQQATGEQRRRFCPGRVEPEERPGRGIPGPPTRFVAPGRNDLPAGYTSVT